MISVVVVTYNSIAHIEECLRSLSGVERIVVDNGSVDGSAEAARRAGAIVLANADNRGFAAAANQGVEAATGDIVFLLNPDTVLLEGFDALQSALAPPSAFAATGVLVDGEGRPQVGFTVKRLPTFWSLAFEVLGVNSVWPGNPVNRRFRCLDLDLTVKQDVEQPAGACLAVRKSLWRELGGLDERFYPLWFEDVDFCLRLKREGVRIVFEPRCRFRHHGAHSLASVDFADRQLFWYRNLLYYVSKHLGFAATFLMRLMISAGAGARMAVFVLRGSFSRARAYGAVIRMAWSS